MTITVEQAQAALNAANKAFNEEMVRDVDRGEGSGRQSDGRDERQKRLSDAVDRCERDLQAAKARKG